MHNIKASLRSICSLDNISLRNRSAALLCLMIFDILLGSSAHALNPSDYMRQNILMRNPNSSCSSTGSSFTVTGNSNPEKIFNLLIEKGLNDFQAAGVLGNIQSESGFSPTRTEDGNNIGWGLVQWSFGRRTKVMHTIRANAPSLAKYLDNPGAYGGAVSESTGFRHPDVSEQDNNEFLKQEVDYLYTEYENQPLLFSITGNYTPRHEELRKKHVDKKFWEAIKSSDNLQEASDIFMLGFERPGDQSLGHQASRARAGQEWLSRLQSSAGQPTTVSSGCNSATKVSASSSVIVKVAMEWAWESHMSRGDPTEKYTKEAPEYSSVASSNYTDCTYFVGSVMRKVLNQKAGEPGFPEMGTKEQRDYLLNQTGGKFQKVNITAANLDQLQPGDIIVTPLGTGGRDNGVANHIAIYGGEELLGSGLTHLEASQGTFAPQRSTRDFLEYQFKSSQTVVIRATGATQA